MMPSTTKSQPKVIRNQGIPMEAVMATSKGDDVQSSSSSDSATSWDSMSEENQVFESAATDQAKLDSANKKYSDHLAVAELIECKDLIIQDLESEVEKKNVEMLKLTTKSQSLLCKQMGAALKSYRELSDVLHSSRQTSKKLHEKIKEMDSTIANLNEELEVASYNQGQGEEIISDLENEKGDLENSLAIEASKVDTQEQTIRILYNENEDLRATCACQELTLMKETETIRILSNEKENLKAARIFGDQTQMEQTETIHILSVKYNELRDKYAFLEKNHFEEIDRFQAEIYQLAKSGRMQRLFSLALVAISGALSTLRVHIRMHSLSNDDAQIFISEIDKRLAVLERKLEITVFTTQPDMASKLIQRGMDISYKFTYKSDICCNQIKNISLLIYDICNNFNIKCQNQLQAQHMAKQRLDRMAADNETAKPIVIQTFIHENNNINSSMSDIKGDEIEVENSEFTGLGNIDKDNGHSSIMPDLESDEVESNESSWSKSECKSGNGSHDIGDDASDDASNSKSIPELISTTQTAINTNIPIMSKSNSFW